MTEDTDDRTARYLAEQARKYGGPAPPLTLEELDQSETEIRNHSRRGPPEKQEAKS